MRISALARLGSYTVEVDAKKPPSSATQVVGETEIYLPLAGVIDLDAERKRLVVEAGKVESNVRASERKLQNRDFVEKAPGEIVEREKERRDELALKLEALMKHIDALEDDPPMEE